VVRAWRIKKGARHYVGALRQASGNITLQSPNIVCGRAEATLAILYTQMKNTHRPSLTAPAQLGFLLDELRAGG
jgi:hypothetical protein